MKNCPTCGVACEDNAVFCTSCGYSFTAAQSAPPPGYAPTPGYAPAPGYAPVYDPYDHTAEFDAKDISDNKVISMLVYLLGIVGIFIALIASTNSPYVAFHVRQALKFTVVTTLMAIGSVLFIWTLILPLACGIMTIVLQVIRIICFFQICSGKAKEPAIIRSLGFLR